jgi:hypothetical protein
VTRIGLGSQTSGAKLFRPRQPLGHPGRDGKAKSDVAGTKDREAGPVEGGGAPVCESPLRRRRLSAGRADRGPS